MSWSSLGSEGVSSIAKALNSNSTLNYLRLTCAGCGDNGADALAKMLCDNKTLTELFISNFENLDEQDSRHNKVGKKGADALAGALRVNKSLKELHLCNNNITYEGFNRLTKALPENTALKWLGIDYQDYDLTTLDQDTREKIQHECICENADILI